MNVNVQQVAGSSPNITQGAASSVSVDVQSPVEANIQQVTGSSVDIAQSTPTQVTVKRYAATSGDLIIRRYATTSVVPTDESSPFMFFVNDDDGNGPAMGFWDGENIQIIISVTI